MAELPKRDLELGQKVMNAAGSCGFAPDPRSPLDWNTFGAFITNPVSMRARRAAEHPGLIEFPGGFLLHTGLPNPGFRRVLELHGHAWAQSPIPIIVNLMADRPEETRAMVAALEGVDNVLAAELGFAPLLSDDLVLLSVEMSLGELPLIVSLPPDQLLRLGPQALARGAVAVSLAAPRGALPRQGHLLHGRLVGPALFPLTLHLVRTASQVGLPTIGAGGIFSRDDARAMLDAGALAVELDASLWLPQITKESLVE